MTTDLATLCKAIVDCEHKTAPEGDGFALSVGTRAMKDGHLVLEACKPVSRSTYEEWTRRMKPEPGDLVLAREAPVGQVIRVPEEPLICLGQRTVLVRPDPMKVHPRFLHYWLLGPSAQSRMAAMAAGATVAHLNVQDIRSLEAVDLPDSRHLQSVVAELLGALDDLIENNQRRVDLLELMAQAIYQEWFVHLRYPGHQDATLIDSLLGQIPDGWEPSTLGEIAPLITRGISPKYAEDGAWRVVNQRCIRDGRVSLDLARRHEGSVAPQKVVRSGDVLVNSTGVGTLGRVGVLLEQDDALTVDSHVTIVRPQNASLQPWFGVQMLQRQTELEAMGVGSTGQTELGRQAIGQLTVVMPTLVPLNMFADRVWPLVQAVSVLLEQSRILASLRDHLLPRLVTGQIDVSSINFDTEVESVA